MATVDFSFSKKYNNVDWDLSVFISNEDISLTTPNKFDAEHIKTFIQPKNILIIEFKNSILDPIPKLKLEFIDDEYAVTNYLRHQNCFLNIIMNKPLHPEASAVSKLIGVDLTFLIKSFTIVSFNNESITYRIFGELNNSIPLNTICKYATITGSKDIKEKLENPYKIAHSILSNAGYPLYPIETNIAKENEAPKMGPSMYMYPDTNIQTHFITYQNLKVYDAINYLFALGGMKDNEPVYLIHKLCDNQGFIASRKTLMMNKIIENDANIIKFDFKITSIQFMGINLMQFLELGTGMGGIDFSKTFFNYEFFEYDHNERKWYTNEVSKEKLNNVLTSIKGKGEESLFGEDIGSEDKNLAFKYQYTPINGTLITDVKKNLDLLTSLISFTVNGNIEIDVGSIIKIQEDYYDKMEQFNGKWLILEVQHSFIDQVFKSHLKCCRVTYMKAEPIDIDLAYMYKSELSNLNAEPINSKME